MLLAFLCWHREHFFVHCVNWVLDAGSVKRSWGFFSHGSRHKRGHTCGSSWTRQEDLLTAASGFRPKAKHENSDGHYHQLFTCSCVYGGYWMPLPPAIRMNVPVCMTHFAYWNVPCQHELRKEHGCFESSGTQGTLVLIGMTHDPHGSGSDLSMPLARRFSQRPVDVECRQVDCKRVKMARRRVRHWLLQSLSLIAKCQPIHLWTIPL